MEVENSLDCVAAMGDALTTCGANAGVRGDDGGDGGGFGTGGEDIRWGLVRKTEGAGPKYDSRDGERNR